LAGVTLAMFACSASAETFDASIQRTAHGIPHITASNFASLGYGYGYAFAQDNLCVMADDYVTVRGERSRFFGPNGSYYQGGNDQTANNLDSDFFFQQIKDSGIVQHLLSQKPPLGPKQEVLDGVRGYVAGYNRYLKDVGGTNGVPDRTCRAVQMPRAQRAERRITNSERPPQGSPSRCSAYRLDDMHRAGLS